jgi:hypothetical protein
MINQLRAPPSRLEDAIQVMNNAADEIDRLLTAINNAQSVLTYEDISSEERISSALGALGFGDR